MADNQRPFLRVTENITVSNIKTTTTYSCRECRWSHEGGPTGMEDADRHIAETAEQLEGIMDRYRSTELSEPNRIYARWPWELSDPADEDGEDG